VEKCTKSNSLAAAARPRRGSEVVGEGERGEGRVACTGGEGNSESMALSGCFVFEIIQWLGRLAYGQFER